MEFLREFCAYLKTPQGWASIAMAAFFYYILKWHIEPWFIETACQNLFKC
jgi:hypothetical protein